MPLSSLFSRLRRTRNGTLYHFGSAPHRNLRETHGELSPGATHPSSADGDPIFIPVMQGLRASKLKLPAASQRDPSEPQSPPNLDFDPLASQPSLSDASMRTAAPFSEEPNASKLPAEVDALRALALRLLSERAEAARIVSVALSDQPGRGSANHTTVMTNGASSGSKLHSTGTARGSLPSESILANSEQLQQPDLPLRLEQALRSLAAERSALVRRGDEALRERDRLREQLSAVRRSSVPVGRRGTAAAAAAVSGDSARRASMGDEGRSAAAAVAVRARGKHMSHGGRRSSLGNPQQPVSSRLPRPAPGVRSEVDARFHAFRRRGSSSGRGSNGNGSNNGSSFLDGEMRGTGQGRLSRAHPPGSSRDRPHGEGNALLSRANSVERGARGHREWRERGRSSVGGRLPRVFAEDVDVGFERGAVITRPSSDVDGRDSEIDSEVHADVNVSTSGSSNNTGGGSIDIAPGRENTPPHLPTGKERAVRAARLERLKVRRELHRCRHETHSPRMYPTLRFRSTGEKDVEDDSEEESPSRGAEKTSGSSSRYRYERSIAGGEFDKQDTPARKCHRDEDEIDARMRKGQDDEMTELRNAMRRAREERATLRAERDTTREVLSGALTERRALALRVARLSRALAERSGEMQRAKHAAHARVADCAAALQGAKGEMVRLREEANRLETGVRKWRSLEARRVEGYERALGELRREGERLAGRVAGLKERAFGEEKEDVGTADGPNGGTETSAHSVSSLAQGRGCSSQDSLMKSDTAECLMCVDEVSTKNRIEAEEDEVVVIHETDTLFSDDDFTWEMQRVSKDIEEGLMSDEESNGGKYGDEDNRRRAVCLFRPRRGLAESIGFEGSKYVGVNTIGVSKNEGVRFSNVCDEAYVRASRGEVQVECEMFLQGEERGLLDNGVWLHLGFRFVDGTQLTYLPVVDVHIESVWHPNAYAVETGCDGYSFVSGTQGALTARVSLAEVVYEELVFRSLYALIEHVGSVGDVSVAEEEEDGGRVYVDVATLPTCRVEWDSDTQDVRDQVTENGGSKCMDDLLREGWSRLEGNKRLEGRALFAIAFRAGGENVGSESLTARRNVELALHLCGFSVSSSTIGRTTD